MPALLLGSIGTLADTSELQRQAFNSAFAVHGLEWSWDRQQYRAMLTASGGAARVEEFARSMGQTVDAPAIHATKSQIFRDVLASGAVATRPGLAATIAAAKTEGWAVGLVTTTDVETIAALLGALGPDIGLSDFGVIVDRSQVEQPKPDPAAYAVALRALGRDASECVAVEDNVDGAAAAFAAGVACAVFPNENTEAHDFGHAARRVDHLDLAQLRGLIGAN